MRERVEDLGRIVVLVKNIFESDLLEGRTIRNKDFVEWFNKQTEETRDEWIHNTIYQIDFLKEKLFEILEIAEGYDSLNEKLQ
jgi:hypothetical protein